MTWQILHGDLFDALPTLDAESIDACVTDPPYGIGFMGKEWDSFKPGLAEARIVPNRAKESENPNLRGRVRGPASSPSAVEYNRSIDGQRAFQAWSERWAREVFRVLKPGAHLIVCGAPRSFHRMTCGLEDAGFEIRDCLSFLFGQGFPKSLNFGCKCGGNAVSYNHAQSQHEVRPLFSADLPSTLHVTDECREVLLSGLSEHGASTHRKENGTRVHEGREQPSMAGRELYRAGEGLSDDPNAGASSGTGERLRSGASGDSGTDSRATITSGGGSTPQGSRQSEQSAEQSTSLRFPQSPLGDGAPDRSPRCERCGGLTEARGCGTALKPGWEPIIVARKPFRDTVADNFIKHGTGALNIDACRIEGEPWTAHDATGLAAEKFFTKGVAAVIHKEPHDLGRWPPNVVLDEAAAVLLDAQSGELTSGGKSNATYSNENNSVFLGVGTQTSSFYGSSGYASRFFYCAKPSRDERDSGCYDLVERSGGEATDRTDGSAGLNNPRAGAGRTGGARNIHPTVKPVELMRWLVRLVTPVGGTVLDPFTGSGTTGMACLYEQRHFVGIEREAEYVDIAKRRIRTVAPLLAQEIVA